jgi:radical SAM protein with 4Fe4S-binding SPASM domain
MNIEDVKVIEENIDRSFVLRPRIHLFGGEPTINKDFVEILNYFSERKYKISMTTNGVNIKGHIWDLIKAKGLSEINISLNTMDIKGLLSTLECFRQAEGEARKYVTIACPINAMNQNKMIDIVREFEGSYAQCITFQHTVLPIDGNLGIDSREVKKNVEKIKRTKYRLPVIFLPDIKTRDIENYYTDRKFPYNMKKCIFPWFVFFIQPNGDVLACEEVNVVMGNAKRESSKEIWNGEIYKRYRQSIHKFGVSHPNCWRCCHRNYY